MRSSLKIYRSGAADSEPERRPGPTMAAPSGRLAEPPATVPQGAFTLFK